MKLSSILILGVILVTPLPAADPPPRSLDDRLEITLFAEHPLLNTPTGIDVDYRGRVWVIESNTHFPPAGYDGHPSDRLLILTDSDGDGRAEAKVFADGFTHSMSVAVRPVWLDPVSFSPEEEKTALAKHTQVFLATRKEILLLEDTDGDDVCDKQTRLVHLDTEGNYPHNGLAGFAFDALGNMFFGFGENLGADYKIIGRDGVTYSGGGEGGNIYQVQPDGTKLKHWATGFWNPHANCVDAFGRLFSVDNDPDSLPPCRLLHIIEGGDYGYRFRNGRKGMHPFTAWNGEIPGTLPMVAGTGEAPSGILAYEHDVFPEEYLGNLIVTSWGDHRIDRFQVEPQKISDSDESDSLFGDSHEIGATLQSVAQPFIIGSENFRPVGIALAPDGSLYISDWVLRDYKLHKHGRVWRISSKSRMDKSGVDVTDITTAQSFEQLKSQLYSKYLHERRMAAKMIAKKHLDAGTVWSDLQNGKFLVPSRASEERRNAWEIPQESDQSNDGLKEWKQRSVEFRLEYWKRYVQDSNRPFLSTFAQRMLLPEDVTGQQFVSEFINPKASKHSSLNIDMGKVADIDMRNEELRINIMLLRRKHLPEDRTIPTLALATDSSKLRRLAVQWIAEEKLADLRPQVEALFNSDSLTPDLFLATLAALEMLDGKSPQDFDKTPPGKHVLPILKDDSKPANVRAIALRLVDPFDPELEPVLVRELMQSDDPKLRLEAVRVAAMNPQEPDYCGLLAVVHNEELDDNLRAEALVGIARRTDVSISARDLVRTFSKDDNATLAREAQRALRKDSTERPTEPDAPADLEAGRRLFYHPNGPKCFQCHTVAGRGGKIGPDLTTIGRAMSREKLIESIQKPSQEVAPQFTNWTMLGTDGKTYAGMIVHENEGTTVLGTSEGKLITLKTADVEERLPQKTSVMPDKLEQRMTEREFRDLVAFLESLK